MEPIGASISAAKIALPSFTDQYIYVYTYGIYVYAQWRTYTPLGLYIYVWHLRMCPVVYVYIPINRKAIRQSHASRRARS